MIDPHGDVGAPLPHVGQRVVLLYSREFREGSDLFPEKRVGEVYAVWPDRGPSGYFDVSINPSGHTVRVDVAEYAAHGCTWREWRRADGWRADPEFTKQERRRKRDQERARVQRKFGL